MRKTLSLVPIFKLIAALLFTTVFSLPSSARCETKAGSVELSPFAGYSFFEDRQNLENSPVFGGRLGYNITSSLGIEWGPWGQALIN